MRFLSYSSELSLIRSRKRAKTKRFPVTTMLSCRRVIKCFTEWIRNFNYFKLCLCLWKRKLTVGENVSENVTENAKGFRKTLIYVIDSLTVRCFLLWHFERVRWMASKWISVMGCDKWSAPDFASRSTSRSLAKRWLIVSLLWFGLVHPRNLPPAQPRSASASKFRRCCCDSFDCAVSH